MKNSITFLAILLAIAPAAFAVDDVEPWPKVVGKILDHLPAATLADELQTSKQLVLLGPIAVKEVAAQVVPLGTGDDTKARYALAGLTRYVMRNGGEADRAVYAKVLLDALPAAKDVEVKTFFLHELQSCGKDDAVPVIAPLLADAALCEPAAMSLQGIGTPAAGAALGAALPNAAGANRITLVRACGAMRVAAAAGDIFKAASDADPVLHFTGLYAAANLPVADAGEVLKKSTEAAPPLERAKGTSFYLLFARRLAETGHKDQAADICREVVKTRVAPDEANVRSAALQSLVSAVGEAALPDLLAAANSSEIELRVAALNFAKLIPGEAATTKWAQLLNDAAADVRVDVLGMLGRRGDVSALPAIVSRSKEKEPGVRFAAIVAATKLGKDSAIPALITVLTGDDAAAVKAAADALASLPGDRAPAAAAESLASAKTSNAKIALLTLLGRRAASGQSAAILSAAVDADPAVRLAALKAMELAARPDDQDKLLAVAAKSTVEAERETALQAAVAAAGWLPEPARRADRIIAAMNGRSGVERAMFLRVLPKVPSREALDIVVADAASKDATVKDAAVRALAAWPEPSAVTPLLGIARAESDLTLQVLALRGAVGLLKGATTVPAADRAKAYAEALEAAKRPEEKKLVLSALSGEHGKEALAVATAAMGDAATRSDAALAVVRIVLPSKEGGAGLKGTEAAAALEKAAAVVTDPRLKEQAANYLKTLKGPKS